MGFNSGFKGLRWSTLRFLRRLHVAFTPSPIFLSVTYCRGQFLRKKWPIQSAFLLFTVCIIFFSCVTLRNAIFDVHVTVHRDKFLIIKPTRCTNFSNLLFKWNSTCFGQFLCPSSGVFHCTHSNGICHIGMLTACEQDQDGILYSFCLEHLLP